MTKYNVEIIYTVSGIQYFDGSAVETICNMLEEFNKKAPSIDDLTIDIKVRNNAMINYN